ncbi:retinoblastoma-like protein 1 isoform X1 [Ornithodoros turicata]|uniref:retinoblastoma-like protein 1 isoform X1 n=1 Tax=Ornithodoros turicata TaxID=34597 RepID=UPI003139D690
MGLSSEGDQEIRSHFQEVCRSLNMDKNTLDQALHTYESISINYTLEGDSLHWIACALYVECRSGNVPTVAHNSRIEGNCVSLTKLLETCKISLLDFFTKMKKWADMANLNETMRQRIETIEKSFCVSAKIYEKYVKIFKGVFKEPLQGEPPRRKIKPTKRRMHRPPLCDSRDMFHFIWILYVYIKGRFPGICCDLVNCYHLLLCCMDFGCSMAMEAKQTELFNPRFYAEQVAKSKDRNNQDPGIIRELVRDHDGSFEDASVLRAHHFQPPIRRLMAEKVLQGDIKTLTVSLDPTAFDNSMNKLNKTYEECVLREGDLDERIFLADDAYQKIGTLCHPELLQRELTRPRVEHVVKNFIDVQQLRTPLTGRGNLQNREAINRSPVSTATQCASKLQTLLAGCKNAPSSRLQEMFSELDPNVEASTKATVKEMGDAFCAAYTQPTADQQCGTAHLDFARMRLQLGETLFYKALENIIMNETLQQKTNTELSVHLCHSVFQQSLFACCMEIVMFCYNSQREFPWILEAFGLMPYNFYKIIEPLIRAEEGLWREVVKHLNHIEEQILESYAWKEESPLWDSIEHSEQPVPACKEVLLRRQLDSSREVDNIDAPHPATPAPLAIRSLKGDDSSMKKEVPLSPVSVADRYQSPGNSVRRRLFSIANTNANVVVPLSSLETGNTTTTGQARTLSITMQSLPGSNITTTTFVPVTVEGKSAMTPATPANSQSDGSGRPNVVTLTSSAPEPAERSKPPRSGSLALFFRKVYHLAGVRLQDLCDRLGIQQRDIRLKIWTCFEHSIVAHTSLMKDRHLDQLILCAVYVITKVTQVDKSFQEILQCYRQQPQNKNHVYRSVLLHKNPTHSNQSSRTGSSSSSPATVEKDENEAKGTEPATSTRSSSTLPMLLPNSQPPTPTRLAGTSTQFEFDERGDIIRFYNEIYRRRIQTFALKFSPDPAKGEAVCLTPLPRAKCMLNSPRRRVSNYRDVFVSPLKAGSYPESPKHHTYHFNQSPAKDLLAINRMVQGNNENVSKRILQGDDTTDDDAPASKRCLYKKIQTVMMERMDVCNSSDGSGNADA